MQIAIVAKGNTESKRSANGKSYSLFELTYKSDGQTRTKKVMNFDRDIYPVLKEAKPGEVYEVDSVKDGEFWKWQKVTKVEGTSAAAPAASTSRTGTWETPEERAMKQIYIARSVALAQAVLVETKNESSTVEDILKTATEFEQWLLAPIHGMPDSLEGDEDGNNQEIE